jgi:hypothetical protein
MIFLILFLFAFTSLTVSSQEVTYSSPVKIPIYLSGSFAELRSNHFHSGIDIKTNGTAGIPVYAVADGYISRIVVSPTGFGLAIYIRHPNGTTSVYGHLESFRDDIARYVKDIQYERKSYSIDLSLSENLFQLKKDEFIARSGNSGSSGGPHLHFEIRDTRTEEPLNPLHYPFPVEDTMPPKIYALMIAPLNEYGHADYQVEKKIFSVEQRNGKYFLKDNPIVPVYGLVGFAVRTNDFFNGSNNRCGVYSIRLYWDGELFYSFRMDRFSFAESRYVNSHMDYEEYMQNGQRFHKAWIDPGNKLGIYDGVRNNGIIRVTDGNIHPVRFEITDLHGNASILDFNVEGRTWHPVQKKSSFDQLLKYDQANHYSNEHIRIDFPEGTFYTDVEFFYKTMSASEELISDVHVIHKKSVPLHNSASLSIRTGEIEKRIQDKALLVSVDTLTGKISGAGGAYLNGWVTGNIRNFGHYAVALDTLPPRIVPLSIRERVAITESLRIRFHISDDLSGIKEYEGRIDGKWALFEYDAKVGILTHYFDNQRFDLKKRHTFRLTVNDNKGNTSLYEASFWK